MARASVDPNDGVNDGAGIPAEVEAAYQEGERGEPLDVSSASSATTGERAGESVPQMAERLHLPVNVVRAYNAEKLDESGQVVSGPLVQPPDGMVVE